MSGCAALLRESIDAGRPVVGYPDADLNVGVCYGYEQAGNRTTFLWNGYGRDAVEIPSDKLGPWQMILQNPVAPMESSASLHRALTTPNWRRSRLPHWDTNRVGDSVYLYGSNALRQWREDIGHADQWTDEQRKKLLFVSWWCFDCLVDARRAAAQFLNDRAQESEGDLRAALTEAAQIHGQTARKAADACFRQHEAFLGPWTGKTVDDWTPDVRDRERAILSEVEESDRRATAVLDRAVALLV